MEIVDVKNDWVDKNDIPVMVGKQYWRITEDGRYSRINVTMMNKFNKEFYLVYDVNKFHNLPNSSNSGILTVYDKEFFKDYELVK